MQDGAPSSEEVPSLHEVQNVIAASFCAVPAWQGRQEEDMFAG